VRRMNSPVETPLGDLRLTLAEERTGLVLFVANEGTTRADRVWVNFRPRSQVEVNPRQLGFGSIEPGRTSARQRLAMTFPPALQNSTPAEVFPVYVVEFEVVLEAAKERMMGAFHISFR